MGQLTLSDGQILRYGQRGRLVRLNNGAEPKKKIPGFNQPSITYQDADGNKNWVPVETDNLGGFLYKGYRFQNSNDLVSALPALNPTPTAPTTPTVKTPSVPTSPKTPALTLPTKTTVSTSESLKDSPLRGAFQTAANYGAKMVSGVGSAFANAGGVVAGMIDNGRQAEIEKWGANADAALQHYNAARDSGDEAARKGAYEKLAYAVERQGAAAKRTGAKKVQESLYGVSDALAEQSAKFQAAAEKHVDNAALRGVLDVITDMVPFFAMNAIPGAGTALSGAYLVGESTGAGRRAELSEKSQAALGLASVLSMGAAGKVGQALGGPKVTQWFLNHGLGPDFARILEQATASGLVTGATRQAVSIGTQKATGVYAEQVQKARENLAALSEMDVNSLTLEQKAARDSAIAANQAIINSNGVDFTAALGAILLETVISFGATGIKLAGNRVKYGPNYTAQEPPGQRSITPEESEYFKGVTTPEEAKQRQRELARQYHPDLNPNNPEATQIMQDINAEYDRLVFNAQTVTRTWRKAKSGEGVTRREKKAANDAIAVVYELAQASGDAETIAAAESVLAPIAVEINAAPDVSEIVPQSAAPVAVPQAVAPVMDAAPVTVPQSADVAPPSEIPSQLAESLTPYQPRPTPFITFEDWRKQHPEITAESERAAKETLAAWTAPQAQSPQPSAPIAQLPAPQSGTPTPVTQSAPAPIAVDSPEGKRQFPEMNDYLGAAPTPQASAPTQTPSATVDKNPEIPQEKRAEIPQQQTPSDKLRELSDRLNQSTRVYMDGLEFKYGYVTPSVAFASIRRVDPEEQNLLYPIQNARNDLYSERYSSDYEARDALIRIAATLPGFRKPTPIDNPASGGYPDAKGAENASEMPKGAESNGRRARAAVAGGTAGEPLAQRPRTRLEIPDGGGVPQSPSDGGMADELDGALASAGVRTPQGQRDADSVAGGAGGLDTGHGGRGLSGEQLRRGAGNHRGPLPEESGAGRGQVLGSGGGRGGLTPEVSKGQTEVSKETAEVPATEKAEGERLTSAQKLERALSVSDSADMDGYHFEIAQSRKVAKFRPFILNPDGEILYEDYFPKREQAAQSLIKHLHSINDFRRFHGEADLDISAPEPSGTLNAPAKSGTPSEKAEAVAPKPSGKSETPSAPEKSATPEVSEKSETPAKSETETRQAKSGKAKPSPKSGTPSEKAETPVDLETPEEKAASEARTEQQIQEKTERAAHPKGTDFTFPEGGLQLPKGEKSRAKANIDAIKILRTLEAEGRPATPEEQFALSKFVGWGGLKNIFDESKPEWAPLRNQLRNLLSDEEYAAAKASTLNAHYTSQEVITAMYDGLERMGFKGGRVLEPSAGIGNFVGAMPAHLRGNSRWTMVELDPITAGIAKKLYPNADVRNMGFEKANFPDNYFDAAISNVPFGDYPVVDKNYPHVAKESIHNYFFAKSLDKVRPGGLVMFITSRYTLDGMNVGSREVREYLRGKADFLGAVRLPDTAFQSNAGTEVVTDILIFKKRPPDKPSGGEAFTVTTNYGKSIKSKQGRSIYVPENEYFQRHPEMVLGVPAEGKMYGRESLTYRPKDTKTPLGEQIKEALSKIEGRMEYPTRRTPEQVRAEIQRAEANGKVGALSKKDGKIYKQQSDGTLKEVAPPKGKQAADFAERAASIISLRDAGRALLNFQLNDAKPELIENSRKGLNALYDSHVKKFGPLHAPENQRVIKEDVDSSFIFSLETYDAKTKTAKKADIFTKNTVSPVRTVTRADTVADGLAVSVNETGGVDVRRIAELTGKSGEEVRDYLLENGLAFLNRDGDLETPEQYLAGNVRAKLKEAEILAEGNPEYRRNVEALKPIIPADIPPEEIKVQIGATWVTDDDYARFAAELCGFYGGITVKQNPLLGGFHIDFGRANAKWQYKNSVGNKVKWGTKDKTFLEIFDALLNNRELKVTYKDADGNVRVDMDATEAVKRKADEINAEFQDWAFRDIERRERMARLYNDTHNNSVTPHYDGSKLTINGMNPNVTLNPHQKDDIWRVIMSRGNTLIARGVGAGKTFEMIGATMKLKEIGAIRKPVVVVPKSLIGQWESDFFKLFPAAKILVPGDDFTGPKRREYVAKIATNDYDAVILTYEQFSRVRMSDDFQKSYIQRELDALEAAVEAEKRENGNSWSVRQMEKSKKDKAAKIETLANKSKDEDNLSFEELGVDFLVVDEFHNFKNLEVHTKLGQVAGVGGGKSDRAFDMLMKTRYLQEANGGRALLSATATPVMNSLVEMYVQQVYHQPDALQAAGLYSLDAWLKEYGVIRDEPTVSADGKSVKFKPTLSRFDNLRGLQQMFKQFVTDTEAPGLKIPAMRGGKRIIVKCDPSEEQTAEMRALMKRTEAVHHRQVRPEEDNMLKIESDARKLTYSRRVLDPSLPYEENGKIMQASRNIFTEWKNSADIRGTQILFCDFSTPKPPKKATKKKGKSDSADLEEDSAAPATPENAEAAALAVQDAQEAIAIYHDIKNILVGMGIPANEIAFIHDAKNIPQRNALFAAMREGKVRVLLGSTGKMGVGMNAQDRVVALHHLDAPYRPGDLEQREGRALRQGNINSEVAIYNYVTEGTLDALMFSRIERKQIGIAQSVSGDFTGNSYEFGSDVVSYGEMKAIASGNPKIQRQAELQQEIRRLESLERAHKKEIYNAEKEIRNANAAIAADTETAAHLKADIAARQDTSGQNFSVTIDGKAISERKAAGETLLKLAGKALKTGNGPEKTKQIGTFAGFDLLTTNGGDLLLRGQGQYRAKVNFESPVGTVRALENAAQSLDKTLSAVESRLKTNRDAIPELEKASKATFAQASELDAKRKENAEILQELSKERPPEEDNDNAEESGLPATSDFREAWNPVDSGDGTYHFREASKTPKAAKKSGTPSAKADAPKKSAANTGNHPERWTTERVGDANTKPLSLSEVIAKHRRIMGLNVTTGHIRGARGQYQRKGTGIGSGGIRLKIQNDLPVFLHETGHAIADRYGLAKLLNASGMDDKTRLSKEGQDAVRARIQARQELIGNLDPQFAAQYKEEQLVDEGIAEFFRRYFTNRVQAQSDYPAFHTLLMQTMSGADQAQLLSMADDVNAALSLDTKSAQSSVRRMDDKSPDYRTRAEKIDGVLDRAIQKGVDSLHAVKKLSLMMGSEVHKEFYNANYADARAHFILTEYLTNLEGKPLGPSLKAALQKVDCNNPETYDAFGEYLIVKNAPSWLEDDKRVLANDRKNNIIYCNLREKELLKEHPEFQKAAEALYQFWDALMRTYVVETGLLSEDAYDAMRAKHPYYVPFKRVMDDIKGFRTHRAFANNPNPIKRAQGSGRDIIHPVDSMINATAKFVYQGIHNQAMLDLVTVADAYGLDAAFMERVPDPLAKLTADISGVKASIAERVTNSDLPEQDVELLLNILDEQGDVMTWYSKKNYLPENCIGVRRNGEIEVYKVNDPLLFDALSGMGRPYLTNDIAKAVNKITRAVSSLITGWNITWSLFSNAPRDLVTALVYSTPEHRAKLLPKIANEYLAAIAKARNSPNVNPLYMEYLAMGGGQASAWGMDTELPKKVLSEIQGSAAKRKDIFSAPLRAAESVAGAVESALDNGPRFALKVWDAKSRALDILKAPLRAIEFVSRTVEAGPRFATYEMFREDGYDPQTAFRAAMEITVDFRKGGEISRALNVAMPFFNAGAQGAAKDLGALSGADVPKKDRAKVVKGRVTAFLVASLIGAAIEYAINNLTPDRRKSYQRLSTYTKNSYYCIPIGDGKYFGIPKARGLLVPHNFFRAALERTIGANRHAFDGFRGYAATAELPAGLSDVITANMASLLGTVTIIGPAAQAFANKDFRGMPIENAKDENISPKNRYTGSTSAIAKTLGQANILSPKKIDFLGNNILGAPWQYQKALFPVDGKYRDWTLGVQSKYKKDSLYSQDSVNRLANMKKESIRKYYDDVTNIDNAIIRRQDESMWGFYSAYNSLARNERDEEAETQSDRHLRDLVLTMIEEYVEAREEGYLTIEQKAAYEVCRKAGTITGKSNSLLPGAKEPTVTDGKGTAHQLTAAQYYDYQGAFNNFYWTFVKEGLPQVTTDDEKRYLLEKSVKVAGDMAENGILIDLGAETTDDFKKYSELQLYSVPISTYLVAKAKTKDIKGLTHKRSKKSIDNSQSALVAKAVYDMDLGLPDTNLKKLMEALNVSKTVREWNESKLDRKIRDFRRDAGLD